MSSRGQLAAALIANLAAGGYPGMCTQTALDWLASENSVIATNPLGILYSTDYAGNGSHTAIGNQGRFAVYSSDLAGMAAAAHLILASSWASGIRQAVKSGDCHAQAKAIVLSPWAGGNYRHGAGWAGGNPLGSGASASGTAKPPTSSGSAPTGVVLAVHTTQPAAACAGPVTVLSAGPLGSLSTVIPIPIELIGEAGRCTQCPTGWSLATADPGPVRGLFPFLAGAWVDPKQLPAGTPNACAAPGVKAGDHFDASAGVGAIGEVIGGAFAGLSAALLGAFGPLVVNGAVLVLILALAYSGLRDLTEGQ